MNEQEEGDAIRGDPWGTGRNLGQLSVRGWCFSNAATMIAGCGGPDFTAATQPHAGDAGPDAGDDVDNTPIILPPDKMEPTRKGEDGGDGPVRESGTDATVEGGGIDAWDESTGSADATPSDRAGPAGGTGLQEKVAGAGNTTQCLAPR